LASRTAKVFYFAFPDATSYSTFVAAGTSLVLVFHLRGNVSYVCVLAFMCFNCRLGNEVFTVPCFMGTTATESLSRERSLLTFVA
jgi:hypothetical protein